ncbi:MAG: 50S ribosomal protein L29 [Dehalococcoidia bacterium]|nr:50S ribosomal protein L29 [Dehalococcoidia bacterium]
MDAGRLNKELDDTYRQLFTLHLQVATRQLQNVKEIGKAKRKVARIKTLQRQRELATLRQAQDAAAGGGR